MDHVLVIRVVVCGADPPSAAEIQPRFEVVALRGILPTEDEILRAEWILPQPGAAAAAQVETHPAAEIGIAARRRVERDSRSVTRIRSEKREGVPAVFVREIIRQHLVGERDETASEGEEIPVFRIRNAVGRREGEPAARSAELACQS